MKKIISLFQRDYDGNRQVYDEVVPGAEWVQAGEGVATEKFDGTACMIQDGTLYKRYDRKLTKFGKRRQQRSVNMPPETSDFKPAPEGWIASEDAPNLNTGHWPGWVPVGQGPEDQWHRGAYWMNLPIPLSNDGTYELVGPKIETNPYELESRILLLHGATKLNGVPVSFEELKAWLAPARLIEGIVWHHPDGRMVKIKRRDFGLAWPPSGTR